MHILLLFLLLLLLLSKLNFILYLLLESLKIDSVIKLLEKGLI